MRRRKRIYRFKTIIMNKSSVTKAFVCLILGLVICFSNLLSKTIFSNEIFKDKNIIAMAAMEDIIPYWESKNAKKELIYNIICKLVGFDFKNPSTIVKSQLNILKLAQLKKGEEKNIKSDKQKIEELQSDEPRYPIMETSAVVGSTKNSGENKLLYINNETSYNIDINALLKEKLSIKKKDGPLVLIVHTHTTESYTPSGQESYSPKESTRTTDINYNVVKVGDAIATELTNAGIQTVHDKTINDYPSYNGSYTKTLGIIEQYLKKYPSIQVVLDVHRDGMTKQDGTKMKVCAEINGEKASQVMVLCGSDEGGLSHKNWKENLKLGLKIQDVLTKNYPGLARPLSLVRERYNQHATIGSMILEVGTDGNTLEEALVCAKYTALAIADVLKKI